MRLQDEIDRLTKATPVLLDTLTLKQQPQILAVTARGAKLQLTALERVAEGVCKQQRDSDDSIRRVKEFADMIDKMLYSDMALER